LALVVLIGAVAIVLAGRSARRAWSDRRSLEEHHRTLGTLGEIAQHQDPTIPASIDRSPRYHVRVVPSSDRQPPDQQPPDPQPADEQPADPQPPRLAPRRPLVIPEQPVTGLTPRPVPDATGEHPPVAPPDLPTLVPVTGPGPVPMPTKPAPTPPEVAAALVAETVDAPVPARGRRHARRSPAPRRALIAALGAVAAAIVVVAVALVSTGGGSARRGPGSETAPRASTPTTAPQLTPPSTVPAAVLVASDNQGATFSLTSQVQIELVPTSNCWVQVREGSATGPVLYEGLLRPGQPYPLPGTGPFWLRLGNPPGVSVVVNGVPLQAPLPNTAQPYNLEFQLATATRPATSG
jgi:hypothetical protein